MIERQFVAQNFKEQQIQEYIRGNLKRAGQAGIKLQRTPLGEKITIYSSHPGLIVGRGGENIKKLTLALKKKFGLENPQIEISEVLNPSLNPYIVAEKIASSLERFGSAKFKGVMHKSMADVLSAGAVGVEIVLSGKIPSTRAKSWRIKGGHIKKSGDIAVSYVQKAKVTALIKTGIIGIKVNIMPPGYTLPDALKVILPADLSKAEVEDITGKEDREDNESEAVSEIREKLEDKKKPAKKAAKKKAAKKKEE